MARQKITGAALLKELGDGAIGAALPPPAKPGGRPPKGKSTGVPLTVRLEEDMVRELRAAALTLSQGGEKILTPQDVIRRLILAGMKDAAFPLNLGGVE